MIPPNCAYCGRPAYDHALCFNDLQRVRPDGSLQITAAYGVIEEWGRHGWQKVCYGYAPEEFPLVTALLGTDIVRGLERGATGQAPMRKRIHV